MAKVEVLYLSQEEVIEAGGLDMAMCIEAVEDALRCHARGDTVLPEKVVLRWGDEVSEETEGRINAMPAYLGGDVNLAGIKWVGSSPLNPGRHNLPRASAIQILNDRETKLPLAIIEGTIISAMRTGSVGGIAAKYLATKNSSTCGIFGAGVQARTQAMAVKVGLPGIERFIIYDLNQERASTWCKEMSEFLNVPCDPMPSCEATVREADLFVTVTTASHPFIKPEWIRPGHTEIHMANHEDELDVINRADKIVVDDWNQVLHRAVQSIYFAFKEGIISDSDIDAELGDVILGNKRGRDNDEQFVYFNAVGMGHEDIAFAARIYETAKMRGIGRMLTLWENPIWV